MGFVRFILKLTMQPVLSWAGFMKQVYMSKHSFNQMMTDRVTNAKIIYRK